MRVEPVAVRGLGAERDDEEADEVCHASQIAGERESYFRSLSLSPSVSLCVCPCVPVWVSVLILSLSLPLSPSLTHNSLVRHATGDTHVFSVSMISSRTFRRCRAAARVGALRLTSSSTRARRDERAWR